MHLNRNVDHEKDRSEVPSVASARATGSAYARTRPRAGIPWEREDGTDEYRSASLTELQSSVTERRCTMISTRPNALVQDKGQVGRGCRYKSLTASRRPALRRSLI